MRDRKRDSNDSIVPEEGSLREDVELEEIEHNAAQKVSSIKKRLKECEKEKAEHLEDLQRVRADFLNSKRRLEEQLRSDRERIADALIIELLPILDSFDLALAHEDHGGDGNWRKGVEAMRAQLLSVLRRYSVTEIDPVDSVFDPNEHEAVSNVAGAESGKVVAVVQKGYARDGRVLRPARVTVGA